MTPPPADDRRWGAIVEAAWSKGDPPDLQALTADLDRDDDAAWCETLVADAECRSERRRSPSLADYLALFPWLKPGSRTVQELLAVEVAESSSVESPGLESSLLARYGDAFAGDVRLVLELHALLRGERGPRPDPAPGDTLGKYRLRRPLGRGASGQVWLALDGELDCLVALKLIAPSLDVEHRTRALLAEARAAASLHHPNVVGVRAAGRFPPPNDWLYIELQLCGDPAPTTDDPKAVAVGQPLTEVRSRFGPDWRTIAELMADVARGTVAAHAQGVVHCDLKPANILVTPSGRAMVADFGLSASTLLPAVSSSGVPDAADGVRRTLTLRSVAGKTFRGTPAYMSPEQARGEPARPLSDVYGMGAVLFWLLCGSDPYVGEPDETWRQLLIRIGDLARPAPSLPAGIHATLGRICLKAMSKRAEDRYPSASAFLADIEAVLARRVPPGVGPDSRLQPVGLWTRRHAWRLGIAAAAGLGLATLSVVAMVQRAEAMKRAQELKIISEFQTRMLREVDPATAGMWLKGILKQQLHEAVVEAGWMTEDQRVAERETFAALLARTDGDAAASALIDMTILRPAAEAVESDFKDQPLVAAKLLEGLADQYDDRGFHDDSTRLQSKALELRRGELGDDHPDTLAAMENMGYMLQSAGSHSRAEGIFRDTLDRRRRILGEEHPDTLVSIDSMANILQLQGRDEEAEPYRREVLEKARRVLGVTHEHTRSFMNSMAMLLSANGRQIEAERQYREALECCRRGVGDDHPHTMIAVQNLAATLKALGRMGEAEPLMREAVEMGRRIHGAEHRSTLLALCSLADLLATAERFAASEPVALEALDLCRRTLGGDHRFTLSRLHAMGTLLLELNRPAEAEARCREAWEKRRLVLSAEDPRTLESLAAMGAAIEAQGRYQEVIDLLAAAEPAARAVAVEARPSTLGACLAVLGSARAKLPFDDSRFAMAEADLLEAHALLLDAAGATNRRTQACVRAIVSLYDAWHAARAEPRFKDEATSWRLRLVEHPSGAPASPGS